MSCCLDGRVQVFEHFMDPTMHFGEVKLTKMQVFGYNLIQTLLFKRQRGKRAWFMRKPNGITGFFWKSCMVKDVFSVETLNLTVRSKGQFSSDKNV